jgi:hypothetical protein
MALHVLKTIVSETDMNKAREALKKEQSIGEAEKHLLKDVKKISAANIVKCGTYVIGKNVADEIMERNAKRLQDEAERKLRRQKREEELELKRKLAIEDKQRKEKEMEEREKKRALEKETKIIKQRELYLSRYNKAMKIIETKRRLTWTVSDYKTVLMALKKKSDGKLPTTLNQCSICYDNWKDRIMGNIVMAQTPVDELNSTEQVDVSLIREDDDVVHSQVNLVLKESELSEQANIDSSVVEKDGEDSSDCIDENDHEFTNSEFYGDTQSIVRSQILL